ncbi:MAG TPA: glycosyltransferase family 39 protein, partial [Anaerolineae bacterium]|nr:glycosyltransferase family 39 protein [Anaerolineae bacterium]
MILKANRAKLFATSSWLNLIILILLTSLITLPRVLSFPPTFLAPDEMKIGVWVSEMADALLSGAWEKTAITNNPYPVVTLAWLEALQAKVMPLLPGQSITEAGMLSSADEDVFAALPRRRLSLALLNSLIILAIFWLLQRLYNHFVAVTATILIALDPFLLTESRVFRAEGLTAGLMMLSALTIILYAKERRGRWLIASGVLAGLATLTRISAFYLFPFAGLVLLAWPVLTGERNLIRILGQTTRDIFLWGLVMAATFVAFWPALWVSPLDGPGKLYGALQPVFTDTTRVWSKGVFFQGQAMRQIDPGVAFYLYAIAYRTTPLIWFGLAAALVGAVLFLRRRGEEMKRRGGEEAERLEKLEPSRLLVSSPPRVLASSPHLATTLLILAYIACYFVAINLSATKIDRYLVAILPGLAILAALGFNWLISSFAGLGRLTWL